MPVVFLSFWYVGTSGGHIPIAAPTESLHPPGDNVPQTDVSSMGRPRIMMTSCNVTVVSPHGRWNMCISGHHRSTSVINVVESIIDRSSVMSRASGRNPAHHMNGAYHSSHVKGLCVRILSDCKHCGTQQYYKNISPMHNKIMMK
jgi:hypothetical protein